jgi:uncharacterized protein (TIGR03437 family)
VTGAITTATGAPPQVTPAPVQPIQVWINGQAAFYVYAGEAPGVVAGMMQLNVQIPATVPSGDLSITVSIGGNMSQSGVTVSVKAVNSTYTSPASAMAAQWSASRPRALP